MVKAEVIAIGSELLLGQIVDTNSSYLGRRLAENGIELNRISAIGDDLEQIKSILQEATLRSQIIITTGGIGPTEDDLTREAVAQAFDRPLVFQHQLMEQIEALFKKRGFRMTENNRKQAFIPTGAIPIENPKGTAPGFIVEFPQGSLITLPGVPSELEYLMENMVIPYIRRRFHLTNEVIKYKVLRACGLGESAIGLQIRDLMEERNNPSVGTLASIGDIKIRITAKAENSEKASLLIEMVEKEIRNRLGILIYGIGDETLQGVVAQNLERLNLSLSVIETMTGGNISQKMAGTESVAFHKGLILPSKNSQREFLDLKEEEVNIIIDEPLKFTELLAQKGREEFKTDLSLATFGEIIEAHGKGEFRMETYYALISPGGIERFQHPLGGELWMIRERASILALDMIRKYLIKIGK
ncbi:MAG: CinA family nicotinamide mononucleotide deamidase-related protein [Thermodesulfobacteriota bacterium]